VEAGHVSEAEVATQPCGFRAPIARTCGDIIMLETPAGISGKWPRALQIEVSGAPRRYATAAAFIEVIEPAYTRQRCGAIDSDDDEEMHNLFGSPSESRGPTPHRRATTATAARTRSSRRPLAFPRAPSREAPQRWTDQPRRQVTTAGGAGSSAPNRVRMSWLLVPLLGAAAHAAPCPGLCYLAVHALGVPRFAAVVALIRRG
jgi:hypothetical protein